MRAEGEGTGSLVGYGDPAARVAVSEPLWAIRELENEALAAPTNEVSPLLSPICRPSIALEKLLPATPLPAFYSISPQRRLVERLELALLFRWFVGLGIVDAARDYPVFSKNRDRLLEGGIATNFSPQSFRNRASRGFRVWFTFRSTAHR